MSRLFFSRVSVMQINDNSFRDVDALLGQSTALCPLPSHAKHLIIFFILPDPANVLSFTSCLVTVVLVDSYLL